MSRNIDLSNPSSWADLPVDEVLSRVSEMHKAAQEERPVRLALVVGNSPHNSWSQQKLRDQVSILESEKRALREEVDLAKAKAASLEEKVGQLTSNLASRVTDALQRTTFTDGNARRDAQHDQSSTFSQSGHVPRPSLPALEKFSGAGKRSVVDFIADAQMLAHASCMNEPEAIHYAGLFCIEQAQQVWRKACSDFHASKTTLTWELFRQTLEAGLGYKNTEWEARSKLMTLTQTGSAKDYAQTFRKLCDAITSDPISGSEKVHKFWTGLKSNLQSAALTDPSNQNQIWKGEDFDRFVSFVLTLEQSLNSSQMGFKPDESKKRKFETVKAAPTTSAVPSNTGTLSGPLRSWPLDLKPYPTKEQCKQWDGFCWYCKSKDRTPIQSRHPMRQCTEIIADRAGQKN